MIAIDWGTSTLRGARLAADDGAVLEERAWPRGILAIEPGGFAAEFDARFGDWLAAAPEALCLVAGMAGSRQGWLEAPYAACPASIDDVVARLAWVRPGRVAIVPGLSTEHDDGVPDVLRGEETQVFGALAQRGIDDGLFVLPGTHSKWVRVVAGRIVGFETAMTGEVYGLLRWQSILVKTMPPKPTGEAPPSAAAPVDRARDDAAFDAGVAHALRSRGLLEAAFSARTLALFGRLDAEHAPAYLSGMVIGDELRGRRLAADAAPIVIGEARLAARYRRALAVGGVAAQSVAGNPCWAGLWAIGTRLG